MKKIIAKMFGLFTEEDVQEFVLQANKDNDVYYEKVVKSMSERGVIPPECDLKLPKKSIVVITQEDDPRNMKIIAKNGKWLRLPLDGEKVIIKYNK